MLSDFLEAKERYDSNPQDKRIPTKLKASLRKRAEKQLSMNWESIVRGYDDNFLFVGGPSDGVAQLKLTPRFAYSGFGKDSREPLELLFRQEELLME